MKQTKAINATGSRTWRYLCVATLVSCVLFSACSQVPSSKTQKPIPVDSKAPGELRVQVDALTKLSDGQIASTKADSLLPEVRKLLSQQRFNSARQFVRQRPDMALETLRSQLGQATDQESLHFIAATYDEQMRLARGRGWLPLIEASQQSAVRAYADARKKTLDCLRHGNALDKIATELTRTSTTVGNPMVVLDQLYLAGLAALLADRPTDAVAIFEQACNQAVGTDTYQEAQLALLLSDAQRRCGSVDLANQTWARGVKSGASVAVELGVFDPVYWDRASYLRPISFSWPPEALAALSTRAGLDVQVAAEQIGIGEAEAIVWAAISRGLLDRGEHQSALVAAKRAEVATTDGEMRGWVRLVQAEALACLDQGPAATAVLVSLTMSRDARLADAATATLGGMKLQSGDATTGFRLLVKALKQKSPPEWIGRAKAEADLGLAYLMRNDEINGMNWLHSAQSRFAHEGDVASLSQSLWNEAAYLNQVKRKVEEAETQERRAQVESTEQIVRR